jgi:glycosyltransferase involved in cell wall biosynthesis
MPLKRIKKRLERSRERKDWLAQLKLEVSQIRKLSNVLVLSPKPTGMNWRGVTNATKGLFGESVLEIPHYYSNSVLTDQQNLDLIMVLAELNFDQVIASGTHTYFLDILHEYKHISGRTTGAIFHGALTELHEDAHRVKAFSRLVHLANEGTIDKLGFVKKGLAETLSKLTKATCYNLNLKSVLPDLPQGNKMSSDRIKVAIPGVSNFNKNLNNQVAAALLLENSEVHVWGHGHDFDMWEMNHRIVNHEHSSHKDFLETLSQCDLALYLSFSESWGQVITECLALGIPCLCSDNNAILDDAPDLKAALVVSYNDNPNLISEKMRTVLATRNELKPALLQHAAQLNTIADNKKELFLKDLKNSQSPSLPPSKANPKSSFKLFN